MGSGPQRGKRDPKRQRADQPVFPHQSNRDPGQRQPQPQLQPRQHRLRHQPPDPVDQPGATQPQQDQPNQHPAQGDLGRRGDPQQRHRRNRLHRLHRDRQAIDKPRGDVEQAKAQQHHLRRQPGKRDGAKAQRQQRADVAQGPVGLAQVEAECMSSRITHGHLPR